ncbi:hypothetical protein HAX54_005837 [Datura stramonium]|uniref:Aminotransferase class I/classII large domain-containing protein n=1 Tax=Datura stramonium TaxID=4076 RepID=A0ABS8T9H6_DATST|nr:hypothetical protein [Datura stramonium]
MEKVQLVVAHIVYNMLDEDSFSNLFYHWIWCSPHNPTGKVFTKDELEIIAGACRTWDILAVTGEFMDGATWKIGIACDSCTLVLAFLVALSFLWIYIIRSKLCDAN